MEEKITCSECKKDLVMKFIEIKDLVFCSNRCIEQYRDTMGHREFQREYSGFFVSGEGKGWVPKYANDYMQMCVHCPKKLMEVCLGEREIGAVYHDFLAESESRHWCCHARFCLSTSLSDGTVSVDAALKVQRYAENKSKEQHLRGVTTVNLSQSFGDLGSNFDYKKLPENLPELQPMTMSHIGACLLCDPAFGQQCEAQIEREFQLLNKAKSFVKKLWCGHTINSLADMLIDREDGEELLSKIVPYADQVAEEKGLPGVTTRTLFIALGRML